MVRVLVSAALVGVVIFFLMRGRSNRPLFQKAGTASNKPFKSIAPSSEGENRFAWIPRYPGAEMQDIRSSQSREQISYGYRFHVTHDQAEVLTFYETHLGPAGFKLQRKIGADGSELHAQSADGSQALEVTVVPVVAEKPADKKQSPTVDMGVDVGVAAVAR